MTEHTNSTRAWRILATAALLLLTFGLALSSLMQKSPTFDEQGFIVRGVAYLRPADEGGTQRIRVGHPPGLNAYNAMLLAGDQSVVLPIDDPSWQGTSFHRPAELFMWEIGNGVDHIMFLARLPSVWLGLLLIALIGRWAADMVASSNLWVRRQRSRSASAGAASVLALLVAAFDPNLMAHMRLATTDLGLTALAALAGYGLWRLVRQPSWGSAVVAGVGLGLLLNTKFTALLFLPLFAIVALLGILSHWRAMRDNQGNRRWKVLVSILFIYPLVAVVTLWAGNGFNIGALPAELPLLPQLAELRIPLAPYLEQLLDIGGRLQVETPAFLLGQYRTTGWWYYFPVAFLLKTPLPTLLLLFMSAVATGAALWNRRKQLCASDALDLTALLIPPLGFFAIALTTDINLGYRHILPVLPFLFVFAGVSLGPLAVPVRRGVELPGLRRTSIVSWLVLGLTAGLAVVSIWIYPHYLAYFNVLAGGPDKGWRSLVDSNLDWGQDLEALAPWMAANGVEEVWLSYFGEARPSTYGIVYEGLDSFPPRLMNPATRPFVPSDPAPGWYAISATNLQGVHFADHDQFAVFRERQSVDKLGYSLFLFDVDPYGSPVNLLLSGIQPDEIDAADFALLATNDVGIRWLDGQQAVVLPQNGQPTWLIAADDVPLADDWSVILNGAESTTPAHSTGYRIWRLPDVLPRPDPTQDVFSLREGRIDFLGSDTAMVDGDVLTLTTTWQQQAEPAPVKMFVHLLDETGDLATQWDGLGLAWEGWRQDDVVRQQHSLTLPADLPAGTYRLVAGLYDSQTQERWRLPNGEEFVELMSITFPSG